MRTGVERLKRHSDFLRVGRNRRRCVTPGFILEVAPCDPHDTDVSPAKGPDGKVEAAIAPQHRLRVGFTASRHVGGAVERNLAKRRLRAAVAAVIPNRAAPGHDYVLIARKETLSRAFADMVADLDRALRKLGTRRADNETITP